MFKKFLLIIVLLALGGAGLIGFLHYRKETVDVVHPVTGPAVEAVYATGTVEPSIMFPVAPRSPGRLMALLGDEGQSVKKDQVLGQLEDADLRKELEQAQADADLARKDFDRKMSLKAINAVSKEAVDQADAALKAANAKVEAAKAMLGYMQLQAPADGVVLRRDGEIGQMIPANQPVFWLSSSDSFRVSADVDEEDISLVKNGQKVLLRADAFPGQTFDGTVQSITPKGDPVARSYRVRISLDKQTPLMIGMTAEANIIVREAKDAVLVPAGAVREGAVWKVEGDTVKRQPVTVGARTKDTAEIVSGADTQDTVVEDAAGELKDGAHLHTRLRDWKAAE